MAAERLTRDNDNVVTRLPPTYVMFPSLFLFLFQFLSPLHSLSIFQTSLLIWLSPKCQNISFELVFPRPDLRKTNFSSGARQWEDFKARVGTMKFSAHKMAGLQSIIGEYALYLRFTPAHGDVFCYRTFTSTAHHN